MEAKEKILVALVFTGIFLPVRLLFYTYVSQYWLGSFGLMTVLMITIIYLSRKNKLGYIGRLINKHIMSFAKGKFGILVIVSSFFFIYFFGLVIYGIDSTEGNEGIRLALEEQGITDIETLAPRMDEVNINLFHIILVLFVLATPNEVSSGIFSLMNDFSDGWLLHLATVILVEQIEILGLILYFRFNRQ